MLILPSACASQASSAAPQNIMACASRLIAELRVASFIFLDFSVRFMNR
jgi:hypothetical protein